MSESSAQVLPVPIARALGRRPGSRGGRDLDAEVGFRFAVVQVGYWLGWASILVVLMALAVDSGVHHRLLVAGATMAAAAANTAAMVVPWRAWLAKRRGRILLDCWSGGLIAFVAFLVVRGSSSFALLLFLGAPFIAVVQSGWRRGFWLAVGAVTCVVAAATLSLPAGAAALRLGLVAASVGVALLLTQAIRREAAAHRRASARAVFEQTLAREANHRVKNDLQLVADLLLLGRPQDGDVAAFDDTAARIRSIATVHRLLTEGGEAVDAATLLGGITANAPVPVELTVEPTVFDAATARQLGIVANELITNAVRHGTAPIAVRLTKGADLRLRVVDAGRGSVAPAGLGLELVRRIVEQGLQGRFRLSHGADGTCAEVSLPARR